jgi:type III restriction enzyme
MAKKIKLHFDPNQEHQVLAIEQTVRLFEGHPKYEVSDLSDGETIGNLAPGYELERSWLEDNLLSTVTDYNAAAREKRLSQIKNPPRIVYEEGLPLEVKTDAEDKYFNLSREYPAFTVEMETGTGKTYAYLRTIYELRKHYGFRKFIIVVPSRAIYEGTAKSFESTREHFKSIYGNETTNLIKYDSNQISKLRGFADTPSTNILVMTIAAFNKKSNKLYKPTEKLQGDRLPFEYIADTRPILILDESQNYLARKQGRRRGNKPSLSETALLTLNPLFALLYSATPVYKPNLIYRLTPGDAFRRNLVKRIEVLGVEETQQANDNQLLFTFSEPRAGYGLGVETEVNTIVKGQAVRKSMTFRKNDDLFEKTGNPAYRGIVIDVIDKGRGVIIFTNGEELHLNDPGRSSVSRRDRFRVQIEETVRIHMQKQRAMVEAGKNIKVLSLFFIDRVANYVPHDGLIKNLFDEAYKKVSKEFGHFRGILPEEVRRGYFAQSKKGLAVDTNIEDGDKKAPDKQAEKAAYELIMKSKEQLLSFSEPVSFIFAHSALKEGWDNPNVFQICTLNETRSERKKRQEIGRGLRLPVDQDGIRDFDQNTNILTVIANESYDKFAAQLQHEYQESGDAAPPAPSDAKRKPAKRNDTLFKSARFRSFWNKLMQGTDYTINVDSEAVVKQCIEVLNNAKFDVPKLSITRGKFVSTNYKITFADISLTGLASVEIERSSTEREQVDKFQLWVKKGDKLDSKDENLKGTGIVDLDQAGADSTLTFADRGTLRLQESLEFSTQLGQKVTPREIALTDRAYAIPDFIARAAEATNLTRRTLLRILQGLQPEKLARVEKNPEGFSSLFVSTIKDVLATHIAENVEYTLNGKKKDDRELEIFFPASQKYPQKEVLPGSTRSSLYSEVQYDSDIERKFIQFKLNEDSAVICFFKFPPKFKIGTPRIILNYNPDWAVIRENEDGLKMELVRETKGNADIDKLQFGDEKRKILCARKHFAVLGINYKVVTGGEEVWW